jgi:hypothetical protein
VNTASNEETELNLWLRRSPRRAWSSDVRHSKVKKTETKSGARRDVTQGPTALNYNPEFSH